MDTLLSGVAADRRQPVGALRVAGLAVAVGSIWYVPWLLHSENSKAIWLSWPFLAANLLLIVTSLIAWINNWHRSSPPLLLVPHGEEPAVSVIIPTCGEPVAMIEATVRSVLAQDWPDNRLHLAVGDDRASDALRAAVERLAGEHPEADFVYYRPPVKGGAERQGDAKSGNLNAGLVALEQADLWSEYVETRDADDLADDPTFLRQCVAQLQANRTAAYVQTVKEADVSPSDPFGNMERIFYRGSMLARHAANAVFPCGSGLLWRRAALEDIGRFPTWNLVEDLHSGVEALRRDWKGVFLPIVGAMAQAAPEDVPNVYKQRGTWAMDTVRLLLWSDLRGLTLRQRLQFYELGLFYLQSIAILIFVCAPLVGLYTHTYPLVSSQGQYAVHFWPETAAIEGFLVALNGRNRWENLWRSRQMWVGLSLVHARSCLMAARWGPYRKPSYTVTRKSQVSAWYWRETLPHTLLVVGLCGSVGYALVTEPLLKDLDVGSMYWACFSIVLLGSFLRKSWFGLEPRVELRRMVAGWRLRRPRAAKAQQAYVPRHLGGPDGTTTAWGSERAS